MKHSGPLTGCQGQHVKLVLCSLQRDGIVRLAPILTQSHGGSLDYVNGLSKDRVSLHKAFHLFVRCTKVPSNMGQLWVLNDNTKAKGLKQT